MKAKTAALLAAVIALSLAPPPAKATLIHQYPQPTAAYTSATNIIPITTALFDTASAWSDGTLTVSSSSSLERRTAPGGGWATWAEDPESERTTGNTIPVLYAAGLGFVDLNFNLPLFIFGVELEPDGYGTFGMSEEYFAGATSLGTVTRNVEGNSGSRLFAGVTDIAFDRVRISIAQSQGFALAQLRYSRTQPEGFDPVPEPSPLLLFGGGLAVLFLARFFWTHREKQ